MFSGYWKKVSASVEHLIKVLGQRVPFLKYL